ncbi:Uncharacterised protein [Legionella pneumophila]|nr:Uncharacterised protein [Legionella pneumophila]
MGVDCERAHIFIVNKFQKLIGNTIGRVFMPHILAKVTMNYVVIFRFCQGLGYTLYEINFPIPSIGIFSVISSTMDKSNALIGISVGMRMDKG